MAYAADSMRPSPVYGEGACDKSQSCVLTPSPPLPRKRGREQTEFAACAESISAAYTLGAARIT
jgi:hypothetical protein